MAFVTALMVLFTLAVPFVNEAKATHTGADNSHTLDVGLETDSNPTGETHTLTATVGGGDCNAGCEVDFEIESGPAARVNVTGDAGTGGTASDDGNSPTTPDMTCTATGATPASCTVTFTSDTAGTHVIRGWVDDDKDNATFDADATEGRNETTTPGSRTEPDDTDVVQKTWFTALPAQAALNCVDESGDDTQVNRPGEAETYTCVAFNDNGAGGGTAGNAVRDGSEPVLSGQVIDAEIAGSNDPDNLGFSDATNLTADRDNACTTDANGSCTVQIAPTKNETGTANICFWIDADNNTTFDPAGDNENDGGLCNNEAAGAETTGLRTDVVTKTWQSPAASTLDASPEVSNNASGTSHTVTAVVRDQFGDPIGGVPVDFKIRSGRNAALGTICNDVLTNSSGTATCTYTDAGTATTSGNDVIAVYRDGSEDATEGRNEATTPGGTAEPDLTDVVTKFWTAGGPPAASTVIVDMLPGTDTSGNGNFCDDTADSADSQQVSSFNPICGVVRDSAGAAIPGKAVTLTYDGPGQFATDADNDGRLDTGEGQGSSITVTADENGRWDASLFSTETGSGTVTATADNQSDTGTKTWTTPNTGGRNIDCTPDTASNPSGTEHVVTCTVTDRFGNPVPNVSVTPTETGPGRLNNTAAQNTNAQGEVEFVVSSTANEAGDQTINAELTADVPDSDTSTDLDDACDQPAGTTIAGEPGGAGTNQDPAPAGNCETSVTKTWGAASPTPTESPTPIVTTHDRSVEITNFKHIRLPGKKKPALRVRGNVNALDGHLPCEQAVPVKVQIRASGEWITRKTDVTNDNGVWKVLIRHVHAKYRAVATKIESADADGNIDICRRAADKRRYSH